MSTENYLLEFARAVRDMQTKQKAYFQCRQKELLYDAIEAEKRVAKRVVEILGDDKKKDKRQLEIKFEEK
jgi:hypothetical protein